MKYLFILLAALLPMVSPAQDPKTNTRVKMEDQARLHIKEDTTPIRLAVRFSDQNNTNSPKETPFNKIYNTNESKASIGANSILINKTGVYRFDILFQAFASATEAPSMTVFLSGIPAQSSLTLIKDEPIPMFGANLYRGNWDFSTEVFLKAPVTISLRRYVIAGRVSNTSFIEGTMFIRFIEE